nr:pilin N-terminal domain-containing protein [Vagococcus allomyrinae]
MLIFLPFIFFKSGYAEELEQQPVSLKVVIHRLISDTDGTLIDNGGREIDNKSLGGMKGLNGVTFSIYEISEQLDSLMEQGKTLEQAQLTLIQTDHQTDRLVPLTTVVTTSEMNQEGVAAVDLAIYPNKRQAFLIKESGSPAEMNVKSDQLIVITPVYSQLGEQMETVHLYPKNILKTATPPAKNELPKTIQPSKEPKIWDYLPKTGELIQSKPFLFGLLLVSVGIVSHCYLKRKHF